MNERARKTGKGKGTREVKSCSKTRDQEDIQLQEPLQRKNEVKQAEQNSHGGCVDANHTERS